MLPVVRLAVRLLLAITVAAPVAGLLAGPGAFAAKLPVIVVFGLALARPADGLIACVGLFMLGGPLSALLHAPYNLTEPICVAFLAGWLLHDVWHGPAANPPARRVVLPALVFGGFVVVSVVARLLFVPSPYGAPSPIELLSNYLIDPRSFQPVGDAALLVEGVALMVAVVRLSDRDSLVARRVTAMAVVAAAAVSALNINRFLHAWIRSGATLETLAANVRALRVSAVFADFNAAGSYLAMMLCIAVGHLLIARRYSGRAAYALLAFLVATALWLTGSRSALPAIPCCVAWLLAPVAGRRLHATSWKPVAATVFLAALVLVAAAPLVPQGAMRRSPVDMLRGRFELGAAALRMAAAHPVTGVGVGRFYAESPAFISPGYRAITPQENAHNQFLQILAELGIGGLVLFLWVLVAVARRARQAAFGRQDPVLAGAVLGLGVFLLSGLFGHPLLIREVGFAFWTVLGLVAALSANANAKVRGSEAAV